MVGFGFMAMGYKPDELSGFLDRFTGMAKAAAEFASKGDNVAGILASVLGLRMMMGTNGGPKTGKPPLETDQGLR